MPRHTLMGGTGSSVVLTANGGIGRWTKKADFGGLSSVDAVGFSIIDKGYIGTGYSGTNGQLSEFWGYNPTTNNWTVTDYYIGSECSGATGFSIGNKGYFGAGLIDYYPPLTIISMTFGNTIRQQTYGYKKQIIVLGSII